MEPQVQKQRIPWLDAAKGFGIFCIVYGHASRDVGLLAQAVYSFHVALCVFLSGYVYHSRDLSLKDHLKKTGYRLLLPYFIWSLISMVIYLVMGRIAASALGAELYGVKANLIQMVLGRSIGNAALWYLPFLFFTYLIMYGYCRILKARNPETGFGTALAVVLPAVVSVAALTVYQYVWPLEIPFGINNALFLFIFFWAGFLLKKKGRLPEKKCWLVLAAVLVLGGIFCALRFNDEVEYMRLTDSNYGRNIYVFFVSALTICFGVCWVFRILTRNRMLQWFGRHAMAILVMHKFPVLLFQVLLGDLTERMGNWRFLMGILISLVSMALCCWVGDFLHRYLPWMLGEKGK